MTPEKPELGFFCRASSMGTRVPLGSSPQSEIRSFSTCLMATGELATRMPGSGPAWYCEPRAPAPCLAPAWWRAGHCRAWCEVGKRADFGQERPNLQSVA